MIWVVVAVPIKHILKKKDKWASQAKYEPGQRVVGEDGEIYICKAWPYSGWCSVYNPCISYGFMAWDKYDEKNDTDGKEQMGNNNKSMDPIEERQKA